jgi:hypothetical protein
MRVWNEILGVHLMAKIIPVMGQIQRSYTRSWVKDDSRLSRVLPVLGESRRQT